MLTTPWRMTLATFLSSSSSGVMAISTMARSFIRGHDGRISGSAV
jgi:hypothetical protein